MSKVLSVLLCHTRRTAMSGQSTINTFFQRKTSTRCSSVVSSGCSIDTPVEISSDLAQCKASATESKKRKRDVNDNTDSSDSFEIERPACTVVSSSAGSVDCESRHTTSDGTIISPERQQKERIEEKRLQAKMTLIMKQTHGLVVDVGPSWFAALEAEFSKPYFLKLAKFVEEERKKSTVYPPVNQVFAWTRMTPIKDTKVVIIGQDPYHGPNQAHGLCFSVQKGVALPPSLENMYKELATDIKGFVSPGHGCLVGWAQQGVLLLNAVLTVRSHAANSHKDQGWETFTDAVISWLNSNTTGTVFLLWGSYAHKKGAHISRAKHHILQGVHPSPLSAYRGFFGCKHFSRCNDLLRSHGKTPIDWTCFV